MLGTGSINNPNIAKTISQKLAINQLYNLLIVETNGSNFKYDTFTIAAKLP